MQPPIPFQWNFSYQSHPIQPHANILDTKNTAATSFTIENNWESLPGDAPLLPFLMNINSEKRREKMAGKFGSAVVNLDW